MCDNKIQNFKRKKDGAVIKIMLSYTNDYCAEPGTKSESIWTSSKYLSDCQK